MLVGFQVIDLFRLTIDICDLENEILIGFCCNCRSLREDRLDAKWKKVAEKENLHQEMHVESLLQRILLL